MSGGDIAQEGWGGLGVRGGWPDFGDGGTSFVEGFGGLV